MYGDYDYEDGYLEDDDYDDLLLTGAMMDMWEMDEEVEDSKDNESFPAPGFCGIVVGIFIVVVCCLIFSLVI